MSKFDKAMIETAKIWAQQSYCVKKQVGAVLASDDGRIIATGYNGTVSGQPNVCEIEVANPNYGKRITQDTCIPKILKTSDFTVHAEQNVLAFCAKDGISTDGATMYITLSPCATCAKFMVQAGIKRVVYLEKYKDLSGVKFLGDCGVEVQQYKGEEK